MMNVYELMDRELTRMHETLRTAISAHKPSEPTKDMFGSSYSKSSPEASWAMNKIDYMTQTIMDSYQANDKELQTRIAELALLGNGKPESKDRS